VVFVDVPRHVVVGFFYRLLSALLVSHPLEVFSWFCFRALPSPSMHWHIERGGANCFFSAPLPCANNYYF